MKQLYAIPVNIRGIVYVEAENITQAEAAINYYGDYTVQFSQYMHPMDGVSVNGDVSVDEITIEDSK